MHDQPFSGFTLIETLIYLGLFGIVMSGILSSFWLLADLVSRVQTEALLATEGDFLTHKLSYDIEHAQSISQPSGTATSTTLVLTSNSGNFIELYLADSTLLRTEGNASLPLSSNIVSIANLSFVLLRSEIDLHPEAIQADFDISATTTDGQLLSQHFSTTNYLFP